MRKEKEKGKTPGGDSELDIIISEESELDTNQYIKWTEKEPDKTNDVVAPIFRGLYKEYQDTLITW